jgi:hypothetical protein
MVGSKNVNEDRGTHVSLRSGSCQAKDAEAVADRRGAVEAERRARGGRDAVQAVTADDQKRARGRTHMKGRKEGRRVQLLTMAAAMLPMHSPCLAEICDTDALPMKLMGLLTRRQ